MKIGQTSMLEVYHVPQHTVFVAGFVARSRLATMVTMATVAMVTRVGARGILLMLSLLQISTETMKLCLCRECSS